MDGARFRALDINSAGQSASPALSTLVLSRTAVVGTFPPGQPRARDVQMDDYDKENSAGVDVRCDTPAEDKHQPRSPVKTAIQTENRHSTPAKNYPLGPAAAPLGAPAKFPRNDNSASRPSSPSKKQASRPASPVKTPRSRPPSRPSSPLKRTPTAGKNEHFETTPTGFRYTIELPESKIVPKKDSGAIPSKSKTSTPVRSFVLVDAPAKVNNSKRASGPAKSATPQKELLRTRAASPEKKSSVNRAEPTPTHVTPTSYGKRDSVKLTKMNGMHAGTPTVEVTKGDVWGAARLSSPLTSESSSIEMQVKGDDASEGKQGLGTNGISLSPASMNGQEDCSTNGTKTDAGLPRKHSMPTNFGEMLRNSSQNVLQTHSSLNDGAVRQEQSFSPTILDKARRNSELHAQSLLGVIATPTLSGGSPTEDMIAPVVRDFANGATNDGTNKHLPGEPIVELRKGSIQRRVPFPSSTPRTPTGTPPALVAAMEEDMNDIRTNLRKSLGEGYSGGPRSPDIPRWPGSSTNSKSHADLSHATDAIPTGNTPRLKFHEHMAVPKQNVLPGTISRSKKVLRTKDTAEAQSPFHSRLPRLSPAKPKTQLGTPGTIPQAPRLSPFEAPRAAPLTPSRVPAMASRRVRYTRETQDKGETVGFASAEDIAKQVEEWNSMPPEKKPVAKTHPKPPIKTAAKTPVKTMTGEKAGFMRPTTTSANKEKDKTTQSYTPPGSPATPGTLPRSAKKTQLPPPAQPVSSLGGRAPARRIQNPKLRTLVSAAPRTPLPRSRNGIEGLDRGALRTPSKEMVSKLDREIDAHLEREARAGRVFTPSGQRISDLLAKRPKSDGQ